MTQVNELLADEPLRTSDCMSSTQLEAHADFNQQFPSAQRSQGGTDMSGASPAPSKTRNDATARGAKNPSFGAQFPSTHGASPSNGIVERPEQRQNESVVLNTEVIGKQRRNSQGVAEGHRKSHAQRSLPSFSQHARLSK